MTAIDEPGVFGLRADGRQVLVRTIKPEDSAALVALSDAVCEHSIYLRFFSANRESARGYYASLCDPSRPGGGALVACDQDRIIGVAGFELLTPTSAEIALLVDDQIHGYGVGTLLLEHLMSQARGIGIETFVANVLSENHAMLSVLRDLGYRTERAFAGFELSVTWNLYPGLAAQRAVDEREQRAEVESLTPILAPRSVAIVGASDRPGSVGAGLLQAVVNGGFAGQLYPVNPHRDTVLGLPAYASVAALPEAPDLAVVAVPASEVLATVHACGERGVRGVVLISSGFREVSVDGGFREHEVVDCAHRYGMRLIGPNCLGVMNADPDVRLLATFADLVVHAGGFGLASQSGALGIAVVSAAGEAGLGLSQFVSLGNKADVSGNDLLQWWQHDPSTRVIGLYLESFGNPRKFLRIARAVSRVKPILALKSGRTEAGQRAGMSHTAAAAAPDVVVDALCEQAGVVRVATIEQLINAARLLDSGVLPAGRRVAIVGNSGGPQILAADAAISAGLEVVVLSSTTVLALRDALPTIASADNPVDLGGGAGAAELRTAMDIVGGSGEVDSILLVVAPTAAVSATAVAETTAVPGFVPVIPVILGQRSDRPGSIATFEYPESAAVALAHAAKYVRLRDEPADTLDVDAAHTPLGVRTSADHWPTGWLDPVAAVELLSRQGIATLPQAVVSSATAAMTKAKQLGYPVAMKATGIVHKTDVAGVRIDRRTPAEVREAFAELSSLASEVLIQPMAPRAAELIVGAVVDPTFGPIVLLGMGGVSADLMPGRSIRLAPVSEAVAADMVAALPASVMAGFRGAEPISAAAVARLVQRVSAVMATHPEIVELDLNPVVARGDELMVVDAKIRIGTPYRHDDPLAPRLD